MQYFTNVYSTIPSHEQFPTGHSKKDSVTNAMIAFCFHPRVIIGSVFSIAIASLFILLDAPVVDEHSYIEARILVTGFIRLLSFFFLLI
jgi:hypothetical protein